MEQNSPHFLAALRDFRRARQRAVIEQLTARLTQQSADLLDYDEVREQLHAGQAEPRGLQEIPLDSIVGSVGRYADFTRSFLPRRQSSEKRWASVKASLPNVKAFPPITVYQIGEAYFVLDGNHRVSIARQAGAQTIQAYVTEVKTKVPLSPHVRPDELICQAKYADFLEETKLDESRPSADLTVTAPGQYRILRRQIERYRHYWQQQEGLSLTMPDAAARWYDEVYQPVIKLIRKQVILRHFPGRTETDLYVWLVEHQEELQQSLGWQVQPELIATDLVTRYSQSRPQLINRVKQRLREALLPEQFEWNPETGLWRQEHELRERLFQDILVPLSGDETGWRTLAQGIEIAQRENSHIHGVHVKKRKDGLPALKEQFVQRCQAAGVAHDFTLTKGKLVTQICEQARWTDLLIYTIAHPPHARPLGRFNSDFHTLIRQTSRPVLVVPGEPAGLKRPLLAYDGSPKAKEALFIAAYLAGKWALPLVVLTVSEDGRSAADVFKEAREYLIGREVAATFVVQQKPVVQAIQQTAEDHQCDFILMGGYGFTPLLEVILGSTVDKILRLRRWPVLICR